jgi:putative acetyltransferase
VDVVVELATAPTKDVRALVSELEAELAAGYLPEQRHGLALDALFEPHIRFFVARVDGAAVGCCGVALFDGFAELKRLYVRPSARGRGVAEALVAKIEETTREAKIARLCLETGDRQIPAMRLYERLGFTRCAAFGVYASMPAANVVTSVFFEKRV